jgi:hypothetical protein
VITEGNQGNEHACVGAEAFLRPASRGAKRTAVTRVILSGGC